MRYGNSKSNGERTDLCYRCKGIPATVFYSSKPLDPYYYHGPFGPTTSYQLFEGIEAFEDLKKSASFGCVLCKLFEDALKTSDYDHDHQLQNDPKAFESGIVLSRERGALRKFSVKSGIFVSRDVEARLIFEDDELATDQYKSRYYLVETDSDSSVNFDLARSWLAVCNESHPECGRITAGEGEMPGRLLNLGTPGVVQDARRNYAALSHCWGICQPLKTSTGNLESQMAGFPEVQLPQTFFDAVLVTRQLGLQYLWIDSLCILQDDQTDFERECARMDMIYANAFVTISASDATDSTKGLFRPRTLKQVPLCYQGDEIEPKMTVIVQPAFGGWDDIEQSPLQSRAWVLQERHLSTRIIHYTKKCLMWECRTAQASELDQTMTLKHGTEIWNPMGRGLSRRFLDGGRSILQPVPSQHGKDPFQNLHSRWYKIVGDYSRLQLSFPGDKLPAIAGFAVMWKRIKPEDEYLAGLWKSDIFKGLSWFPGYSPRRLMERDVDWPPKSRFAGIPSWSWAAFDGGVNHCGEDWFGDGCYDFDVLSVGRGPITTSPCPLQLHTVTTTTVGQNPFGQVNGGSITLSSWSFIVTLSEEDLIHGYQFADLKAYRVHPDIKWDMNGMVYFDDIPFHSVCRR